MEPPISMRENQKLIESIAKNAI